MQRHKTKFSSCTVAGCGSVAGLASSLISGPVEHIRIRLQLQGPRAPPTIATVAADTAATAATHLGGTRAFSTMSTTAVPPVEYNGSVDAFRSIYAQHGLRGVFRGLPATGLREAVGCGVYFGVYEVAKRRFAASVGGADNLSMHHFLMAGGISGVVAWIPSYPIDIIKSKLQADVLNGTRRYPNVRATTMLSAVLPVRAWNMQSPRSPACRFADGGGGAWNPALTGPARILQGLHALLCARSSRECNDLHGIWCVKQPPMPPMPPMRPLPPSLARQRPPERAACVINYSVYVQAASTVLHCCLLCRDGHEVPEPPGLRLRLP
jgi:hypothetical protein